MNAPALRLRRAPIVEAVVDFDCDMPSGFNLETIESAAASAFPTYVNARRAFLHQLQMDTKAGQAPEVTNQSAVAALRFFQGDEKQLVQVRTNGYSFNRLAPYSSLDDYLPEVERTWMVFRDLVSARTVTLVRLRYINRILLPLADDRLDLDDYLKVAPRLPEERELTLTQFFSRQACVERGTGNSVNIVLTAQPVDAGNLPVILDIEVARDGNIDAADWNQLSDRIQSLRALKNRVFKDSLTEKCLTLFE